LSGEKILHKTRPSWKSYLGIFIWAGVFFILATSIFVPLQLSMLFQVIIVWYIITALWGNLRLKYTVTINKIIKTSGIIIKRDYEVNFNDISFINIKQTTFQRILNISDLEVVVKGGLSYSPSGIKMKGIKKAKKIKEVIEEYRKKAEKRREE